MTSPLTYEKTGNQKKAASNCDYKRRSGSVQDCSANISAIIAHAGFMIRQFSVI